MALSGPTGEIQVSVFEEKIDGVVVSAEGDAAFGFIFCGGFDDSKMLFFGRATAVSEVSSI